MDEFLTKTKCDRCQKLLDVRTMSIRTMSWFNNDTICMECADKETEIKSKLRFLGKKDAMEGCGYIPSIEECDNCNGYGSSLNEDSDICTKCHGKGLLV